MKYIVNYCSEHIKYSIKVLKQILVKKLLQYVVGILTFLIYFYLYIRFNLSNLKLLEILNVFLQYILFLTNTTSNAYPSLIFPS